MTFVQFREKGTLALVDINPAMVAAFCNRHDNGVETKNALVWMQGITNPFLLEESADDVRAALKKIK